MKQTCSTSRLQYILAVAVCSLSAILLSPSFSFASSEGGSAELFVSAWLVRIWLALAFGSVIVIGVLIALDCYSVKHTEPVLNEDRQVVLKKVNKLCYWKIGGGLFCAFVGSALFVTSVFLLPDKRTGHSGLGKIAHHITYHFKTDILDHFKKNQGEVEENAENDVPLPVERQH